MPARFEIAPTSDDKHVAHIRAGNGQITWATETYAEHASAEKAIRSLLAEMAARFGAALPDVIDYHQAIEVRSRHGALLRIEYEERTITRANGQEAPADYLPKLVDGDA